MDTAKLLQKLLEIETSIGSVDELVLRTMMREAEDGVLASEREILQIALENASLRRRIDNCEGSRLCWLSTRHLSEAETSETEVSRPIGKVSAHKERFSIH